MQATKSLTSARAVEVADRLPSAPRVLAELQELLKDANADLEKVTSLLRRDTGLTARVIRIANGVVYNSGDPVASLEEALGRVGFNEVHRVTGLASISGLTNFNLQFYNVPARRLRENSLYVALAMEELAPYGSIDPRAAYTMGLMRSIGKIALDATAQSDLRYLRPPAIGTTPLLDWERDVFGLTSPDIAVAVLRKWRFPADVFVPIRDHYLKALAVDPLPEAKYLLVAAALAAVKELGLPGEQTYWDEALDPSVAQLGLATAQLEKIGDRAYAKFERLRATME
ncbi:MAG: HDOD domain-containing protein [Verrucomicrobia bacterium]|nr:HDOD domain-containing protein [Verrucomicrobiota bacterium]